MRRVTVMTTAVALVLAGGCSGASDQATLTIDAADAPADQPVRVTVSGLHGGERITISADTVDRDSKKWHAAAQYRAGDDGVVDLGRSAPAGGDYQGVDAMGLFWSMNPAEGDPSQQFYLPRPENGVPVETVRITVSEKGHALASGTATRRWLAKGVTQKVFSVSADKVAGRMFLPKPDGRRHPGVLLIGGSEGGMSQSLTAALLATHGYAAFSIAYFHDTGLPSTLKHIPLEYFATAARLLAAQAGVDPRHVLAFGTSRGAEAALLTAGSFPDVVHGVVLYAPTAIVVGGFPDYAATAWSLRGKAVGGDLIPVGRVSGPVLAIAGTDDAIWSSATSAQRIVDELDTAHVRFPHRALVYPGAGHNVGSYPYQPQGTSVSEPLRNTSIFLGGTRPATAAAQQQAWPQVLALLHALG